MASLCRCSRQQPPSRDEPLPARHRVRPHPLVSVRGGNAPPSGVCPVQVHLSPFQENVLLRALPHHTAVSGAVGPTPKHNNLSNDLRHLHGRNFTKPVPAGIHHILRWIGFTFSHSVPHNTCCNISRSEDSLKVRTWLLILLFVHVLVHPWVHAIGMGTTTSDQRSFSSSSTVPQHGLAAADQCELCRVSHNATVTIPHAITELLNPHWIYLALQAVNYASLQADRRIPSRAPPIL